jgi:predicted Zn-dependent protease
MIQGTAAAGLVLSELLMRSYSREFEDQADEEGQRLAAAAGFDPEGTKQLMATLDSRLPQSKKFGYWRTHPFFEERVDAAAARGGYFKVQPERSAASYRAATQAVLLEFLQGLPDDSELAPLLKGASLNAWPQGEKAEELRLERLHALREAEGEKAILSRDYGAMLATYRTERDEVRELTPESPFLKTLEAEINRLSTEVDALYPKAVEVFDEGVYETSFLESFLSNYPHAAQVPEAALALATAYSRLGRQTDAVDRFLQAREGQPDGEVGAKALQGLRTLAPALDRLAALEQLCAEIEDDELEQRTRQRLEQLVTSYRGLDNGAEYLKRFPEGPHSEPVTRRMEELAERLYGEVVLYQEVGEGLKALERIQDILTYAPFSEAADRLRKRAVIQG